MQVNYLQSVVAVLVLLFATSCSNTNNDKPDSVPAVVYKKDTSAVVETKQKAPIINITDTVTIPGYVLVVKDSAATSEGMSKKMSKIYDSILPAFAKNHKIEIESSRMAWYKKNTAPFFFEAGYRVNKKPNAKLPKNIIIKELKADSCVVAHFFGPYDLTYRAYEALNEWLKDYDKKQRGAAYEIYIGDLYDANGKKNDPYKVQTDIVFPHK